MKKLLKLLDNNILRFGVAFAILFTALYPKLPSININHIWVYIRLEDFVILALSIIWLIQLLRKKVSLPRPEGYALIAYWGVGLVSLIYCFLFIAPHLSNFFPQVAILQYFRRIEYMILFFIAFSTVKNVKDVYFYLITLCITVFGVVLYGFGQRFYLLLWHTFPEFFKQYPFCFPAFLTGNEEFAKGIPLCLNETSRITSTFGGHYDLSAYLVFVIPIFIALVFGVKRWYLKLLIALLAVFALELLNFTSSRTSFAAYVGGVTGMLILWHRKRWILPVLLLSMGVMLLFSNSTIQRFSKTIQQVQVVSVKEELPPDLQKIITKAKQVEDNKKPEVPPASDVTVGPSQVVASPSAVGYTTVLTDEQLKKLQSGDVSISTVSGSFLIRKAYALDVSFTTRFQAEWPRNWKAFLYSPLFGTGYSSLTLATDNDYLRALGETGILGLLSFLFIFVILGIFMKQSHHSAKDPITKAFLFGLVGGGIGLLINAVLIDVFEASKVAEPLWILLGVGVGAAKLHHSYKINYRNEFAQLFTSRFMIALYLVLIVLIAYIGSLGNFFVGKDFTLLREIASFTSGDLLRSFLSFQAPNYQPLTTTIFTFLYMLFSFQPEGYHLFAIILHLLSAFGFYHIVVKLSKKKAIAFLSTALFVVLPMNSGLVLWVSNISVLLSSCFGIYAMLFIVTIKKKYALLSFIAAAVLLILSFLSLGFSQPRFIINEWLYLSSAILTASFVFLFHFTVKLVIKHNKVALAVVFVTVAVFVTTFTLQIQSEQKEWKKAGEITKKTLAYFRTVYASFSPTTELYFIDTPLVKNNVPVFVKGLADGLWFIYRDNTPRIYQLWSLEEARAIPSGTPGDKYIFQFKNDAVNEVK